MKFELGSRVQFYCDSCCDPYQGVVVARTPSLTNYIIVTESDHFERFGSSQVSTIKNGLYQYNYDIISHIGNFYVNRGPKDIFLIPEKPKYIDKPVETFECGDVVECQQYGIAIYEGTIIAIGNSDSQDVFYIVAPNKGNLISDWGNLDFAHIKDYKSEKYRLISNIESYVGINHFIVYGFEIVRKLPKQIPMEKQVEKIFRYKYRTQDFTLASGDHLSDELNSIVKDGERIVSLREFTCGDYRQQFYTAVIESQELVDKKEKVIPMKWDWCEE